MRKIFSLTLISMLIFVAIAQGISYESNIKIEGAPSIVYIDGNFYLSFVNEDNNLMLTRVKFRLSGEHVPILLEKEISQSPKFCPDIANYDDEKVIMGWVHDEDRVYIELYDLDKLTATFTHKYLPDADGPVSVFQYDEDILNTWVSSKKPGLTFVITDVSQTKHILDERFSEYRPENNTGSVAQYDGYLYSAWYDDDGKVHITVVQLNSTKTDSINDWVIDVDAKTDLPPAVFATQNGILFVAWADDIEENIYVQAYKIDKSVLTAVNISDFPINGCNGLDITVVEKNVYVAYSDEEGKLKVEMLKL
jgi:hypothetical protein